MSEPAVLVVDDESTIRQLIERILSENGWKVGSAASGPEALEALSNDGYHLVLTDFMMPEMTGIELCRHIQTNYPGTTVILLSGQATLESAVEAFKYGVYDYLLKPFSPESLLASANRWRRAWELEGVLRHTETVLDTTVGDLIKAIEEVIQVLPPKEPHHQSLQKALQQVQELSQLLETLRTWTHVQTTLHSI